MRACARCVRVHRDGDPRTTCKIQFFPSRELWGSSPGRQAWREMPFLTKTLNGHVFKFFKVNHLMGGWGECANTGTHLAVPHLWKPACWGQDCCCCATHSALRASGWLSYLDAGVLGSEICGSPTPAFFLNFWDWSWVFRLTQHLYRSAEPSPGPAVRFFSLFSMFRSIWVLRFPFGCYYYYCFYYYYYFGGTKNWTKSPKHATLSYDNPLNFWDRISLCWLHWP